MASLFHRTYQTTDPKTGKVIKRKTKKWYGKYQDENGEWQREPLSPNKTVAQQMLARLVDKVERKKGGLYHPSEDLGRLPLDEHIKAYQEDLLARGIGA